MPARGGVSLPPSSFSRSGEFFFELDLSPSFLPPGCVLFPSLSLSSRLTLCFEPPPPRSREDPPLSRRIENLLFFFLERWSTVFARTGWFLPRRIGRPLRPSRPSPTRVSESKIFCRHKLAWPFFSPPVVRKALHFPPERVPFPSKGHLRRQRAAPPPRPPPILCISLAPDKERLFCVGAGPPRLPPPPSSAL